MLTFKLKQLATTSFVALTVSAAAIEAQDFGIRPLPRNYGRSSVPNNSTELKAPATRFQAIEVYNTLKRKAENGDPIAREVIAQPGFKADVPSVTQAVDAYNAKKRQKETNDAAPTAPLVEEETATTLPMPERRGGSRPLPRMHSRLSPPVPTSPAAEEANTATILSMPSSMPGSTGYREITVNCMRGLEAKEKENTDLKNEISALKNELEAAKLNPGGSGKVSAELQRIYAELEDFLKTDPLLQYKKIKELLESLLAENDSDAAITKFLSIFNKYQAEDNRGEKITNLYIKINEEGVLKDYFLNVMRMELREAQRIIHSEGDKILEKLPPQPDVAFLVQNPLLMICYTDKDKAKGFWITNNLKTYNQFILSTKPEYLKAVYTFLTKKWKLRHPLDVVTTTPMEAFLISIYEQIESHKSPTSLKMSNREVSRFIEDRLKTDLPVDFAQLEQDNLKFEKEFNNLNIQRITKQNPFLKILEVGEFEQWSNLGFERADYDKMVSFLPYCTLNELKAILYHLSKLGLTTKGDQKEQFFYKAVAEQVKTREMNKQTAALQKIISTTETEMNGVAAKISPQKPGGSALPKRGAPPPPPPPRAG
jgi:hypothetical protein